MYHSCYVLRSNRLLAPPTLADLSHVGHILAFVSELDSTFSTQVLEALNNLFLYRLDGIG